MTNKLWTKVMVPGRFTQILIPLFLIFLIFVMSNVTALDVQIPTGGTHVETWGTSTGNKLHWEWQSTSVVVFSVVSASHPNTVLYTLTASSDTNSISVQSTDTYLLLWFNPNQDATALNFNIRIEAGGGSLAIPVIIVVTLVAVLIGAAIILNRNKTRKTEAVPPAQHQGTASTTSDKKEVNLRELSHPVCPRCSIELKSSAKYCPNCGESLK